MREWVDRVREGVLIGCVSAHGAQQDLIGDLTGMESVPARRWLG